MSPKNKSVVKKIETLVEEILKSKNKNPESDTTEFEKEIDRWVYELPNSWGD